MPVISSNRSSNISGQVHEKIYEKAKKVRHFKNATEPLIWIRDGNLVTSTELLFEYNAMLTVISFLNNDLHPAILNAFNTATRAQRAVIPVDIGTLNSADIQDITKLSKEQLLGYFSCNDSIYAGYVVDWDEQHGVVCRSPCHMNYCMNQAKCQHPLTGPSCKCVPRTIYSSFGEHCEHLSMNLRAFFGILFGALAFLLLLMLAIFVIVWKCKSNGRNRLTNETNSIGDVDRQIFSWQTNPFSSKIKDTSILPSLNENNLSSLAWKPHLENVNTAAEIKIQKPSLRRNGDESNVP